MRSKPSLPFDLLFLAALGLLLVLWPKLDLMAAGLFYEPSSGFWLKDQWLVRWIYLAVPWISRVVLIGLLLFLLAAIGLGRKTIFFVTYRKAAFFLLLVAIIGPLLLVNAVFKDHWGRARPAQVTEFGGSKIFTPAAVPTDQCEKNCSFVSGHASTGFFFLAPAFVFPRRRRWWLAVGICAGLGVGLVRMMQGGHFLSDVIFSGIVVYLTAYFLYRWMYRPDKAQDQNL